MTEPLPEPIQQGTYKLYETPDGGYVLVVTTQEGEIKRTHVPGAIMKMITGDGFISKKLAKMMGGSGAVD